MDNEIIIRASAQEGVSTETIAQVEHSRSLSDRIIEAVATISLAEGMTQFEDATVTLPTQRELYQGLIQWVIQDMAREDSPTVFVAHGSGVLLAGMSGLLRILVTASPSVRVERLMTADNLNERQARKAIQDSDR